MDTLKDLWMELYMTENQRVYVFQALIVILLFGAFGACPIGSLQAVISDVKYKFSFYIVGFLTLIGITLGRFVCGWLCPFWINSRTAT